MLHSDQVDVYTQVGTRPRWKCVLQVENYSGWKISWVGTVPNYTQESHLDFQGVFSLGGKYFQVEKNTARFYTWGFLVLKIVF